MTTPNEEQAPEMELEEALQHALELIGAWVQESAQPAPQRLDVFMEADDLPAATEALIDAGWGYLCAITGLDLGPEAGAIEVIYHFSAGADVLAVRLKVDRDDAQVPTVCGVIPSASFYERELSEMLGVTVRGTPNTDPLFLPENWPAGVYPLRKDYAPEETTK